MYFLKKILNTLKMKCTYSMLMETGGVQCLATHFLTSETILFAITPAPCKQLRTVNLCLVSIKYKNPFWTYLQ
jgi:hypothetical protein